MVFYKTKGCNNSACMYVCIGYYDPLETCTLALASSLPNSKYLKIYKIQIRVQGSLLNT